MSVPWLSAPASTQARPPSCRKAGRPWHDWEVSAGGLQNALRVGADWSVMPLPDFPAQVKRGADSMGMLQGCLGGSEGGL